MLSKKIRKLLSTTVIWLFIIFALFFFLFPIYWIIQMAFKTNVDISAFPPKFLFAPTMDNFAYVFSGVQPYTRYLLNSILVSLGVTIFTLIISALAGYSLSRHQTKATRGLIFSILISRALPAVTIAIPMYLTFRNIGLLGTRTAIILAHLSFILPMSVWITKSFFDHIPIEIEEAAKVDGADIWYTFFRIALPLARPGLISAGILSMIFSWNEFLFSLVLSNSNTRTMSVAVASFAGSVSLDWGRMCAAAVITITPMIIFTFLMQRYLVRGLLGGAVKG